MLLYDIIERGASLHPDRTAFIYRDTPTTYGELSVAVNRLANSLRQRGVRRGDYVAMVLPNCPQFTIGYFAVTALGAVCVPANPLLKPAELAFIWNDARAVTAIVAPSLLAHALETRAEVASIRTIITTGEPAGASADAITFADLLTEGTDERIDVSALDPKEPAVCIYTSGTTGRPKGAMLSHHNLTINAEQITRALQFEPSDNFLSVLPLFHAFGATVCQNTSLLLGASSTILDMFHPAHVLAAIQAHRVTIFPGVPAMFGALMQFPTSRDYDFSSVRLCVSGGAPMPVALMQAFEEQFHTVVIEGDGPTECSPVTSVNPMDGERKPGSIGLPVPGVEMAIFDERDRPVPDGEVGEIVVRGENVMLGYHNQPEATAEAMRTGWYHTGDLGQRDEDGYFYIVDRKKDMLIVGGLNVYPREVEEVLYTHPAVADAAVIGAPDGLRGEEVVAVVALKPGAEATARELTRYCRAQLANYKVPRRVIFRDALPRGGTGKVLKRLLRKELDLGANGPE